MPSIPDDNVKKDVCRSLSSLRRGASTNCSRQESAVCIIHILFSIQPLTVMELSPKITNAVRI